MMTGQGCGGDQMPTTSSGLEKGHDSQTLAVVLIFFLISTDGFGVTVRWNQVEFVDDSCGAFAIHNNNG